MWKMRQMDGVSWAGKRLWREGEDGHRDVHQTNLFFLSPEMWRIMKRQPSSKLLKEERVLGLPMKRHQSTHHYYLILAQHQGASNIGESYGRNSPF